MKRKIRSLLPVAALLLGIALILYPTVSEYINSKHQSRAIETYHEINTSLRDEERERILNRARDYNRRLAATEDSFFYPERVEGYDDTLDITGTGIMGYITINKINVELPIYHSVKESVLQIAAGHLPGTSLPVGGEGTHTVISGHRGLPSAKLFSDLDKIELGDTFTITILSELLTYQVDDIQVFLPYEVDTLKAVPGKDYCTLFTCTPYGINTHRLFIRAHRIDNAEEEPVVYIANEAFRISPIIVTPAVAAPMLIVLFFVLLFKKPKEKKKRSNSPDLPEDVSISDTSENT